MTVFVVESARPALRGLLTRWMLEVHPGVFVGQLSARVRDKLWETIQSSGRGAVLIARTASEQGFRLESVGDPTRGVFDFDGLQLMRRR